VIRPLYIVCPVYYEQNNIDVLWKGIKSTLSFPFKIYFIYDEFSDPTVPIIRKIIQTNQHSKNPIELLHNKKGGVLEALKLGFQKLPRDVPVLVLMSDLSDDLSAVQAMLEAWKKGASVVAASRFMAGGKQIGGPYLKRCLATAAGKSLYYLGKCPIQDVTNNFRMYDSNFLKQQQFESKGGFEIALELTVKAIVQGKKVVEVPTTWVDRIQGKSRFKMWRWIPLYLRWYFYLIGFRKRATGQKIQYDQHDPT